MKNRQKKLAEAARFVMSFCPYFTGSPRKPALQLIPRWTAAGSVMSAFYKRVFPKLLAKKTATHLVKGYWQLVRIYTSQFTTTARYHTLFSPFIDIEK